jgi:hypothetical protein
VSVAQGFVLLFASSVVRAAGFFIAALLLARGLGPAGRGSVASVTVGFVLDLALIPAFGESGAAAAASAAFLAGGTTVAVLYHRRCKSFTWGEIVPTPRDLGFLRLVAARMLPGGRGA